MNLARHLEKKGAIVPSKPATVQDAAQALEQIQDNIKFRPLHVFADIRNSVEILPLLSGVERLQPKSRGLTCRIIEFLSESHNFSKSQRRMCEELGCTRTQVWHIERTWPHFWRFINLVVRRAVFDRTEARVDGATAQAAIHGNDRDRRLYFEVHGRLKQRTQEHGGTIVFVNNLLDRPDGREEPDEPVVIDAMALEASDDQLGTAE